MDRPFEDFTYTAQDGLKLHARIYGQDRDGTIPVICLPGLTRNSRDFHELALSLAARSTIGRVVAFDYRGRGGSAYDRDWKNYKVTTEARDVLDGAAALGLERAAFIATSRGGLITLTIAGERPHLLGSVIFNDIGPVVEGDGLAMIRSNLNRTPTRSSFEEALAFQKAAHGASFPALAEEDWTRLVHCLYRQEGEAFVPDFDPNLLKTLAGIDFSRPLPVLWNQFAGLAHVPVMVIRGDRSRLLSQATMEEMERRHQGLETALVAGQGHPPMLESSNLPETIGRFIEKGARHP